MNLVQVQLSEDLAEAVQLNRSDPSADAARLLALELFPEDRVSLGRAAALFQTPVEALMEFAGKRHVPLHHSAAESSRMPHPWIPVSQRLT
jgi:predicted HTH domain antitoxin